MKREDRKNAGAGNTGARLAGLCCAATIAAFTLSGCSAVKGMFTDKDQPPLPGKRESILQLQSDLSPDPALQAEGIALPDAWVNKFWPQAGGYPNHALGQLSLGEKVKRVWKTSIGEGGDSRTPLIAAPVVVEDSVFTLDTAGNVSAFALKDGKRLWRQSITPRGEEDTGALGGGLAYDSGKLYVTNGYRYVMALDPAKGSLLWKADIPEPARAAPTVVDKRLYLVTLDNKLMVFNADNGEPLWNYAGVSETTNLLGSASPAADQSLVVLPLSSGELYGLRPENGQVVWQDNLSAVLRTGALSSIADIRGLPVIDQGVVYAASFSGRMVALDRVTGQRLWQRELGSANTPWTAGEVVYVLTADQQLVALSRKNGGVYWSVQLPAHEKDDRTQPIVWTGPVLAGGRLFAVSTEGKMDEISPLDGKVMKTTDLGDEADISPIVADDTLLVLTNDGTLSAYR
ncbi:MAG: PQQ-binding-like beta-propeller repeat protein [Alphaproteobacteria bacterium]|nr:PQQ-binding-like beta-propeller repeat protein [Alphaproteobacteria bacterium]